MKRTEEQKFGRKILLSMIAVMGLAIQVSVAQTSTVSLGLFLGPNYANLSSNNGTYTGSVNYQAGAYAEWRIANQFAIVGEGQYTSFSVSGNNKDSIQYYTFLQRINYNATLQMNMLHVTALFKYYIPLGTKPISPYDRPDGSGNYFTLFIGPYMSVIMNPTMTGHIKSTSHYADTSIHDVTKDSVLSGASAKNGIATANYGATLGAGVNLRLAKGLELTFDLRYSRDLTTLDNPLVQKVDGVPVNYGFLGTRNVSNGALNYTDANAYASFISFNVGLNIKLFEIGG